MTRLSLQMLAPLVLLVVAGILGCLCFGCFAWKDWTALRSAQHAFEVAAASNVDLRSVFTAAQKQAIHRTNLEAEGTWTLLSALVAALGVHGLATAVAASRSRPEREA